MKYTEINRAPIRNLNGLYRAELYLCNTRIDTNDSVLEIGCGSGLLSFVLSKRCKHVVATDISSPIIDFLNSLRHPDNISYVTLDATKPPTQTYINAFDKVICIDVLEHVKNRASILNFVYSALKKGGEGVIIFPVGLEVPVYGMPTDRIYLSHDEVLRELKADDPTKGLAYITYFKLDLIGRFFNRIEFIFHRVIEDRKASSSHFEYSTCFQIIKNESMLKYLHRHAVSLIFSIHKRPYKQCESGHVALLVLKKY